MLLVARCAHCGGNHLDLSDGRIFCAVAILSGAAFLVVLAALVAAPWVALGLVVGVVVWGARVLLRFGRESP